MSHRLLLTLAVVVSALAFVLTLLALPSDGTVTGVCVDAKTGRPLSHVAVTLSRKSASDDTQTPDSTAQDARGETSSPAGWTQTARWIWEGTAMRRATNGAA
jgi:hypothetical protein